MLSKYPPKQQKAVNFGFNSIYRFRGMMNLLNFDLKRIISEKILNIAKILT